MLAVHARLAECLHAHPTHAISGYSLQPHEVVVRDQVAHDGTPSRQQRIDQGFLEFERASAGACLTRLGQQSCEDFRRDFATNVRCYDEVPVRGLVLSGGYCSSGEDCADPRDFCRQNDNACPATQCTPRPGLGESCLFVGCQFDLVCVDVSSGVEFEAYCVERQAPGGLGEACFSDSSCEAGLLCVSDVGCSEYAEQLPCQLASDCPRYQVCLIDEGESEGVCGVARDVGERCRNESVRVSDCRPYTSCLPDEDGVARCRVATARLGEPCRSSPGDGSPGVICMESRCELLDFETREGVCVPLGGLGEECSLSSCDVGLECTSEGCVEATEPCSSSTCPDGSYCSGTECVPVAPEGEACSDDVDCGLGAACVDQLCARCE